MLQADATTNAPTQPAVFDVHTEFVQNSSDRVADDRSLESLARSWARGEARKALRSGPPAATTLPRHIKPAVRRRPWLLLHGTSSRRSFPSQAIFPPGPLCSFLGLQKAAENRPSRPMHSAATR